MRAIALAAVVALFAAPAAAQSQKGMSLGEAVQELILQTQIRVQFQKDNVRKTGEGTSSISEGKLPFDQRSSPKEIVERGGTIDWPRILFPDGRYYPVNELCTDAGRLVVKGRATGALCQAEGEGECARQTSVSLSVPAVDETFLVPVRRSPSEKKVLFHFTETLKTCPG